MVIHTESVGFCHYVELNALEGFMVFGKVRDVVPPHGVDVGLADLVGELGMVRYDELEEVFVSDEGGLLNHLSICAGMS